MTKTICPFLSRTVPTAPMAGTGWHLVKVPCIGEECAAYWEAGGFSAVCLRLGLGATI